MGFFTNILLSHGPGSPGQTAKVICAHLDKYRPIGYRSKWRDYFQMVLGDRITVCISNPRYDEFQVIYARVSKAKWDELFEKTKGSLTAFVFILMYFETTAFRNFVAEGDNLSTEQKKLNREKVLEIIYNVVRKSPYADPFSLPETFKIMEDIGGYYYFSIGTKTAAELG
jgi:hypothetical protein